MTIQDKIRGSLIGGTVGDALGYPVEFMSYARTTLNSTMSFSMLQIISGETR